MASSALDKVMSELVMPALRKASSVNLASSLESSTCNIGLIISPKAKDHGGYFSDQVWGMQPIFLPSQIAKAFCAFQSALLRHVRNLAPGPEFECGLHHLLKIADFVWFGEICVCAHLIGSPDVIVLF